MSDPFGDYSKGIDFGAAPPPTKGTKPKNSSSSSSSSMAPPLPKANRTIQTATYQLTPPKENKAGRSYSHPLPESPKSDRFSQSAKSSSPSPPYHSSPSASPDPHYRQTNSHSTSKPPKPFTPVLPPSPIIYEGILLKQQSMSLLGNYQPRYFIMGTHCLWYYPNIEEFTEHRPPSKQLKLDKTTYFLEEGDSSAKHHRLSLISEGKKLIIKGETEEEFERFKAVLHHALKAISSNTAFELPASVASKTASPYSAGRYL